MTGSGSNLPDLERPSFVDGQRLTAPELEAAQAYEEQLRWLHARALHDWGISLGLDVTGAKGAAVVQVGAGYAVDRLGRELVLPADTTLPVPAVSGRSPGTAATWFLAASHPDPNQDALARPSTALGSPGAVLRQTVAALRWLEQDPALGDRRGLDLVLAQVSVAGCRLQADAAAGGRRDVTPGGMPYISAGSTPQGGTTWQLWQIGDARPGVRTMVSTLEAGFRSVPFYQAQLAGERVLSTQIGAAPLDVLVDGPTYVTQPTATGFELRVALQGLTSLGVSRSDTVAAEDLEAVIGRFSVPQLNLYTYYRYNRVNPVTSLFPGFSVNVYVPSAGGGFVQTGDHVLTLDDVRAGFQHFADRHGITLDELARQNSLDLSGAGPLTLNLGQQLVVSRGTAPVNPLQVTSQPGFLDDLTVKLGWHVTWLGVER